tara:strand:- start:176 stop:379 length:204 start_codon:yes stop_codon:yes gene_type:complete
MKYKELIGKTDKECDEILNSINQKLIETFITKSENDNHIKTRRELRKDRAKVLTYKNQNGAKNNNDN